MEKKKKALIIGSIGLVVIAAVVVTLILTLSNPLEAFSSSRTITNRIDEYEMYYLQFKDGNVILSHNFYREKTAAERKLYGEKSGDYIKVNSQSTIETYPYKLSGNQIEVNGEVYEFNIYKDKLYIKPIFLGVSTIWE